MIELDCSPRILTIGRTFEVSVKLPVGLAITGKPRIFLQAFEGAAVDGAQELPADCVKSGHGCLSLHLCLEREQEYLIRICPRKAAGDEPLAAIRIYGVKADIAGLRPFKGDFHMHSSRSDGKDLPVQVAVACRRVGLDFMALTDHGQYEPSLEVARPFAGLDLGLAMFPGEEVHPPGNPVHMINFGGRASVNRLFGDPSYKSEVAAIAVKLGGFKNKARRLQYASCLWCYDKIRELGGLGIFCHPYWIYDGRFNVCEELIAHHFKDRPFNAFEVFGGYSVGEFEANTLQIARYHEERMRDPNLPIVGTSDSHGCDTGYLFGWYYTIVFASSTRLADLCAAVCGLRSVAVAALPGQPPQVVGPFRLVKLALFLMREYMPAHDRLCADEARVMQDYLGGVGDSTERLADCREKNEAHHQRLWQDRTYSMKGDSKS